MNNRYILIGVNVLVFILLISLGVIFFDRETVTLSLEKVDNNGRLVLTEQLIETNDMIRVKLDCDKYFCDNIKDTVSPDGSSSYAIIKEYNRFDNETRGIAFEGIELTINDEYCPITPVPAFDLTLFQYKGVNCSILLR